MGREQVEAALARLGLPAPPAGLTGWTAGALRPAAAVRARLLALHVAVASARGLPSARAWDWLDAHGLRAALTPVERWQLIGGPHAPDPEELRRQGPALGVLAWALGLLEALALERADDGPLPLPDVARGEGAEALDARARPRREAEVRDALDVALALSWAAGELADAGLPEAALWERRRALQWLLGDDWDAPDFSAPASG